MGRPSSTSGGRSVAAKRAAKAKSKPASLEDQRRSRILQMQRLYGLADEESDARSLEDRGATPSPTSLRPVVHNASVPMAADCSDCSMPYANPALAKLREGIHPFETEAPSSESFVADSWQLPPVPEDSFNMSTSMGDSGGLIAWSKNLHPEELSPSATLAAFFDG